MKTKAVLVCCLCFLVVLLVTITSVLSARSEIRLIERNWGVEIPYSVKELHVYNGSIGFTGDGQRFGIYSYSGENLDGVKLSTENTQQAEDFSEEFFSRLFPELSIEIPSKSILKWAMLKRGSDCAAFIVVGDKLFVLQDIF